jgi:hypothetical protein
MATAYAQCLIMMVFSTEPGGTHTLCRHLRFRLLRENGCTHVGVLMRGYEGLIDYDLCAMKSGSLRQCFPFHYYF